MASANRPKLKLVRDVREPIDFGYTKTWDVYKTYSGGLCFLFAVALYVFFIIDICISDIYEQVQAETTFPGWLYACLLAAILISQIVYVYFALSGITDSTPLFEYTCIGMLTSIPIAVIICGVFNFMLTTNHSVITFVPTLLIFDTIMWFAFMYIRAKDTETFVWVKSFMVD